MTTKEHRNAVKYIEMTFSKLESACEHNKDWQKYLDIIRLEEKQHNRFCPDSVVPGLTVAQSVKLFAVKEVFNRWVADDGSANTWTPKASDYFHIRQSVFAACAIAHECADAILHKFNQANMRHFLETIDYAKLNKDPRTLQAA